MDVLNNGLPLVDLKVRGNGYNVEIDDNSITHSLVIDPTIIVDATHDIPFYKEFLAETCMFFIYFEQIHFSST